MNNVSQISKAKRLTEEEVHEAAEELKESGVRPSSIEIYKYLGRGSLTTITNFLKTWDQAEMPTTALPALIIPDALKKSAEQLILKVWAESQDLAEHEINSQREALKQAEALANEKIAEAEAFSEEQYKRIEALETQIDELKKENQALKQNLKDVENVLTKENKSLIEKAAKLEGELSAWKEIKPKAETKKNKNENTETIKPEKQKEWIEEK